MFGVKEHVPLNTGPLYTGGASECYSSRSTWSSQSM